MALSHLARIVIVLLTFTNCTNFRSFHVPNQASATDNNSPVIFMRVCPLSWGKHCFISVNYNCNYYCLLRAHELPVLIHSQAGQYPLPSPPPPPPPIPSPPPHFPSSSLWQIPPSSLLPRLGLGHRHLCHRHSNHRPECLHVHPLSR